MTLGTGQRNLNSMESTLPPAHETPPLNASLNPQTMARRSCATTFSPNSEYFSYSCRTSYVVFNSEAQRSDQWHGRDVVEYFSKFWHCLCMSRMHWITFTANCLECQRENSVSDTNDEVAMYVSNESPWDKTGCRHGNNFFKFQKCAN